MLRRGRTLQGFDDDARLEQLLAQDVRGGDEQPEDLAGPGDTDAHEAESHDWVIGATFSEDAAGLDTPLSAQAAAIQPSRAAS